MARMGEGMKGKRSLGRPKFLDNLKNYQLSSRKSAIKVLGWLVSTHQHIRAERYSALKRMWRAACMIYFEVQHLARGTENKREALCCHWTALYGTSHGTL